MPKWTDYTIKTEPADNDEVMLLDTAGKANKRLGLSALSDWIIGKIANKVFENLQTQNKTILGALNELNSKSWKYKNITFTNVTIPWSGYINYSDLTRREGEADIPENVIFAAILRYGSNDPKQAFVACSTYLLGTPMTITEVTIAFVYV